MIELMKAKLKHQISLPVLRSCFEIDEIIVYVLKILTHLPFGVFPLRGRGKNYPAGSGL
jgi:hypothetical protein